MNTIKDTLLNFQYQYSKLFNLGFNRKRFDYILTKDKLIAINTSKNTFLALLFTLFGSGHLVSGIAIAYDSKEKLGADFFSVFFVLFIVGLIAFRQFLWLINGRQVMTIENDTLTLYKRGTYLTKYKVYSFDKVENIREAIDEDKLSLFEKILENIKLNRKIIFSHIIGQVLFDYNGKTIKLFCDLNKNERIELINEMNKRHFTK